MNEMKKTSRIGPMLIFVLGVLYILSPIDLAPDVFPIVGWLDDIGVGAYLFKTYKAWRQTVSADAYRVTSIK